MSDSRHEHHRLGQDCAMGRTAADRSARHWHVPVGVAVLSAGNGVTTLRAILDSVGTEAD